VHALLPRERQRSAGQRASGRQNEQNQAALAQTHAPLALAAARAREVAAMDEITQQLQRRLDAAVASTAGAVWASAQSTAAHGLAAARAATAESVDPAVARAQARARARALWWSHAGNRNRKRNTLTRAALLLTLRRSCCPPRRRTTPRARRWR
jgi:hypothetical protein